MAENIRRQIAVSLVGILLGLTALAVTQLFMKAEIVNWPTRVTVSQSFPFEWSSSSSNRIPECDKFA